MENFETVIGKDGGKSKASLPSIKDLEKQANKSTGYIDSTQGHDIKEESKYGEDITAFSDLNEQRGQQQGLGEKYKNGLIRGLGAASTSFAEGTVGALVGVTEAIATGDSSKLWNNEFGQGLDKFTEYLNEAAPIYYTQEQQNSILNANFIPDKLFNGAGYMAGAIASGYAGGKVFGALGKLALANKLTPGMMLADEAGTAGAKLINAAKTTKLVNGAEEAAVGALSAHGESAQEARGARKDTYDKIVQQFKEKNGGVEPNEQQLSEINRMADAAGNVDYLTNLVVTGGTNMLQFGKLMTGAEGAKKQFWQVIRDKAGNYTVPELSTFGKLARKVAPYTSGMGEETLQEGVQYAAQIGTSDYYSRKYDKKAWNDVGEAITSAKDALIGTINSKEGFESMLLGGILGAGGGVLHNENKATNRNTDAALQILGQNKLQDIVNKTQTAAQIKTYENDQQVALANKDVFEYKNLNYDKYKTLVTSRVEAGQFNDFMDELDEQKSLTEEQFKSKFGFPEDEKLAKPVPFLIDELKKKAEYIKNVKESVDTNYPVNSPSFNMSDRQFNYMKTMLFHTATTLDDTNKRIHQLKNQITSLSTSTSPIEMFDSIKATTDPEYLTNYLSQVGKNITERKAINPASEEVKKLEEFANDIVKLETRRQVFVKTYNSLQDTETAKTMADEAAQVIANQDKLNEEPEVTTPVAEAPVTQPTTKTPEVKVEATKVTTKPIDIAELENKRFTKTDGEYTYQYKIIGGKIQPSKVSKNGKELSEDNAERQAAFTKAESHIDELNKLNGNQLKDLIDGKEVQPVAKEKEVNEEPTEPEQDNSEQVDLDKLFGPPAELPKKGKTVEPPQPPIEDIPEKEVLKFREDIEAGYTLDKTTATLADSKELDKKPSRKRWSNFVDNLPAEEATQYGFQVVSSKTNPKLYDELLDPSEREYVKNNPEEVGVHFMLVDSVSKEPIKVDEHGNIDKNGKFYLSTLPLKNEILKENKLTGEKNTPAISPQHFLRMLGEENPELGVDHPNFPTLWKQAVDEKNAFRTKLENGEISYVPIVEKTPGATILEDSKGEPIPPISAAEAFFSDINNPKKDDVKFFVPDTAARDENNKKQNYQIVNQYTDEDGGNMPFSFLKKGTKKVQLGALYVIKNNRLYRLTSRKLKGYEANNIKDAFAGLVKDPNTKARLDVISNYVYLTEEGKDGPKALYYDSKTKEVVFGNDKIAVADINTPDGKDATEALVKFLGNRQRQVDKNLIKKGGTFKVSTIGKNGFIDTNKKVTYNEFLFGIKDFDDNAVSPAFTIQMRPLSEQQHNNSYLVFDSKNAVEGKPLAIKEEEIESTEGAITEAEKKEIVEAPAPEEFDEFDENAEGEGLKDPDKYSRLSSLGSKNYKKEDIAKVTQWFKERFGETQSLKITKGLIDGKAFGQFYAGITYLWEQAEEGTLYHEAYHKVEEEYLTEHQVEALHKETEKALGRKLTVLEGKEYRAEDFRNYILGGQKAIAGRPLRNTYFRRLYNYIKSLLTGNMSVEQVYKKLASAKGFSNDRKVSVSFDKFNRKFAGLTETQTKIINDSVTGILLDELYKSGLTPGQLTESKYKVELLKDAYTNAYKYLVRKHKAETDPLVKEQTAIVLRNWKEFKSQHIKTINSFINIQLKETENTKVNVNDSTDSAIQNEVLEENTEDRSETKGEFTAANEIDTVSTVSNNSKLLLASLEKRNPDGSYITNSFGEKDRVDANGMYRSLLKELKGLDSMDAIYSKLTKLVSKNPDIQSLIDRLEEPANITNMSLIKASVWRDFYIDFNKAESVGTLTLIDEKTGKIYQVDANRHNLVGRIREDWEAKLKASPYADNSGEVVTLKSEDKDGNDLFKLNDKEFLKAIGIELEGYSDEELKALFNKSTGKYKDDIAWIRDSVEKLLKSGQPVNNLFKVDFDKSAKTNLNNLLELAAERSTKVVELSYTNAEGKRIYAITLPNYFSKIQNALNNSLTWEELIGSYPQFDSVTMQGSQVLNQMYPINKATGLRERNSKVSYKMTTVAGIKINEDNESGQVITKADIQAKYIQEFNDLFQSGFASIPRTSDKGTEQAGGVVRDRKNVLLVPIDSIAEKGFDTKEVREIFVDGYFQAELARIRSFNNDKLGTDIKEYNKKANDWSTFADILSPVTKELLNSKVENTINYLNSEEQVPQSILDKVFEDVKNYLENESVGESQYDFGSTKDQMIELGLIVNDKNAPGISSELTDKDSVDDIVRAYTVNHMIQTIEHVKLFYGDKALYKDFFKRTSAAAGTKTYAITGSHINNMINNSQNKNFDEYDSEDTYKCVVDNDVINASRMLDEYTHLSYTRMKDSGIAEDVAQSRAEAMMKPYSEMTEADAQCFTNPIFHRHFCIKAGDWTELQEKQYKYEMATMYVDLHDSGTKVIEDAAKLEKYRELAKVNPEGIINVKKGQYFGSQVYAGLNAPTFHKYSMSPLTWRLVKGTNLEQKMLDMIDNQVGYLVFISGVKVGARTDADGNLNEFYKDGEASRITKDTVHQVLPYNYLGIQVQVAPKAKEEVIFGTQPRKLFESNIFDNGVSQVEGAEAKHKEYLNTIQKLVDIEWNKLLEDLGVELNSDGSLKDMNVTELVRILKSEGEGRQLADNLVDSIDVDSEGNLKYPIDSLVNRPKLESLMMSLVSSRVVRQKMSGDAMPQLANTGLEKKGKRNTTTSNELLTYRRDPVTGKTLPIQIKVPLNAQYKDLLKKYGTIEKLNAAIKNDENFDKRLLLQVGYRIPAQGPNSIEFMEVVEFLTDSIGNSIVLPSECVAKSGGDFDYDKLNVFRPNFDTYPKVGISRANYVNQMLQNPTPLTKDEIREIVKGDGDSEFELQVKAFSKAYDNEVVAKSDVEVEYVSDDSKAGLQNKVIEFALDALENPYMYEQLVAPNSTTDMDVIVDNVRLAVFKSKNPTTELTDKEILASFKKTPSATQELMWGHIANQFKYFLGGKAAVGQDAINIAAHVLFQQAGTKISAKESIKAEGETPVNRINLDVNKSEDKEYILLGSRFNKNGKMISDIYSQIANLHLDAAKDPKYKDINLTAELLPTIHMLIHMGAAEDTIIYLMSQPIILELIAAEQPSILDRTGITKFEKTTKFMNDFKKKNKIGKDDTYVAHEFSSKDNEDLLAYISDEKKPDTVTEWQMLEDFKNYRSYAQEVSSFVGLVNYDTTRFKDLAQINERIDKVKALGTGLFSKQDYQDILDNTIVGSFNKTLETTNMYSPLFTATEETNFKNLRKQLISNINPQGKMKDTIPNLINNDFLGYITQKFGTVNGVPVHQYIETLNKGENSVAKRLVGIKSIEALKDNYLLNQLQSLIADSEAEPDNITIYSRKLTKTESDTLTGAYRELMEYQGDDIVAVHQFTKDLTTFGILQSGLHNSPLTYLGLIPFEQYQDITKQAVDNYTTNLKNKEFQTKVLEDFKVRFYLKNLGNNAIVPMYSEDENGLEYNLRDKAFLKAGPKDNLTVYYNTYTDKGFINLNKTPQFEGIKFRQYGYKLQDYYLNDIDGLIELDKVKSTTPLNDNPFVDSTPVVETKGLPKNQYKLPSGKVITFNEQQVQALDSIENWHKSKEQFFTLSGYAGTGKTTIVKKFIDGKRVVVSAPTHKARKVIEKTTGKDGFTIQALLGLAPNTDLENFDINKPQFDPKNDPKMPHGGLLVVDEASMLNKDLFKMLLYTANSFRTKILFMGDEAQIPPVGEAKSDVFTSDEITSRALLTKVERQADGNPLALIYDAIRNNITSSVDAFKHVTSVNSKGEGITFTNSVGEVIDSIDKLFTSKEYKANPDYAKVIAWTNKAVGEWNQIVRSKVLPNATEVVEKGDVLMTYKGVGPIENSTDFKVIKSERTDKLAEFEVFQTQLQEVGDDRNIQYANILVPEADNERRFAEAHNSLLKVALAAKGAMRGAAWKDYYAFKGGYMLLRDINVNGQKIGKDIDYGYAVTAHKSQGSTYTNVIVDDIDISKNSNNTERNQIKYVALSRPTTHAIVYSNKGASPEVEDKVNNMTSKGMSNDAIALTMIPKDLNEAEEVIKSEDLFDDVTKPSNSGLNEMNDRIKNDIC